MALTVATFDGAEMVDGVSDDVFSSVLMWSKYTWKQRNMKRLEYVLNQNGIVSWTDTAIDGSDAQKEEVLKIWTTQYNALLHLLTTRAKTIPAPPLTPSAPPPLTPSDAAVESANAYAQPTKLDCTPIRIIVVDPPTVAEGGST
jgi:hypothetical protein